MPKQFEIIREWEVHSTLADGMFAGAMVMIAAGMLACLGQLAVNKYKEYRR